LEMLRPAAVPGFKLGNGDEGGYSYFGVDPKKADGYVIHRFWPRLIASGHVIHCGKADELKASGMFVHAIQGMRPNLVAASWNFAHFLSEEHGGVAAIQMEFKTTNGYGRKANNPDGVSVRIGSLVVGGKLASITTQTVWPGEEPEDNPHTPLLSNALHLEPIFDPDTGYDKPCIIDYRWIGPSVDPEIPGTLAASLKVDVGDNENPKGLIEKVDVLAEIPYVVKMTLNYVAGTKPYVYQWTNPTTLTITGPDDFVPGLSQGLDIQGTL